MSLKSMCTTLNPPPNRKLIYQSLATANISATTITTPKITKQKYSAIVPEGQENTIMVGQERS